MPERLRIGMVHEHFTLPWHLALEAGAIDVEVVEQPGGTGQMREGIETGELDLALMLTEGAIAAMSNGLPAVATRVYQASPLYWGIHAAGTDHRQLDDFDDDVRFAISRFGSGSHLMAFVLAEQQGWRLSTESFVPAGGLAGAREVLAQGTADLFLWDRYMTSPLVESGEFEFVSEQPTPWPALLIVAHHDVLRGRSHDIEDILDAVDGHATAFLERDDRIDLVVGRYGISPAQAGAWFENVELQCRSPLDPGVRDHIEATLARVGAI